MRAPPTRPPAVEELLAPHRVVPRLPPAVEARVLARAASYSEAAATVVHRPAGRPRWVFALATGLVLTLGVAAFAAGPWRPWGHPVATPPEAPAVATARPSRRAVHHPAPAPVLPEALPVAEPEVVVATPPRRPAARVSTRVPTNAELQLLRQARQNVTDGDHAGALALVAEHARRFRNGSLVEEREALRVMALNGLGRREDARRSAVAFRARFPSSVFLPTFDRMREAKR